MFLFLKFFLISFNLFTNDNYCGDNCLIQFENENQQQAFCLMIQRYSPVESYLTPIPDTVPGYDCNLLMAGGSFIEGSTIELSADGPTREPYAIYMQGGLSYFHVKIALKGVVEELLKNNLLK